MMALEGSFVPSSNEKYTGKKERQMHRSERVR
jgi:hypothetical protein